MSAAEVLSTWPGSQPSASPAGTYSTPVPPGGRAAVGRAVSRLVWLAFRRFARGRPDALALAEPLAMIAVIATWAALLVTGWALVYLPHVEEGVPHLRRRRRRRRRCAEHLARHADDARFR